MKDTMTLLFMAAVVLTAAGPSRADDKIRVVATIPDLADMTRHVGGDLVDVTSLATGVEDIHAVPMKPSFAVLLNRADAVVLLGLIGRARLPAGACWRRPAIPASSRTRPATSMSRSTSPRSRCRSGSIARSAISIRWAIRTSISIRYAARTWRGRSPTACHASIRSTRRRSRRTWTPTSRSSMPRSRAGRRWRRRSRA